MCVFDDCQIVTWIKLITGISIIAFTNIGEIHIKINVLSEWFFIDYYSLFKFKLFIDRYRSLCRKKPLIYSGVKIKNKWDFCIFKWFFRVFLLFLHNSIGDNRKCKQTTKHRLHVYLPPNRLCWYILRNTTHLVPFGVWRLYVYNWTWNLHFVGGLFRSDLVANQSTAHLSESSYVIFFPLYNYMKLFYISQ